ncbi:MAG TPA: ABC transporter permease subunit [Anaerolineae bacterium]|nr:ABC transporter permease subunit [Anaerolineae bacterium]
MSRRDRSVSLPNLLLATVGLLLIWQLASMVIEEPVLPPPAEVLRAFSLALPRDLGRHLLVSAWRVVASILVAVAAAVPAGLALGLSPTADRLAAPVIYLLYPIPKIVFLPVILLLLGIGDVSKVFMIALILFFQMLVVVRDAAANLRPELVASVRSLGAGRRAIFRFVYLPACLPAVLTSLRVSIGTAIAVLFFAESFATTSGIGYYIIVETWGRLAYPEMYAGVVAMSLLGMTLYIVVNSLERRLCPWLAVS